MVYVAPFILNGPNHVQKRIDVRVSKKNHDFFFEFVIRPVQSDPQLPDMRDDSDVSIDGVISGASGRIETLMSSSDDIIRLEAAQVQEQSNTVSALI